MASNTHDGRVDDAETDAGVSVSRLYQELVQSGTVDPGDQTFSLTEEHSADEIASSVTESLFGGQPFAFDESMVKGNLDEILVLLVALRDSETHGKGLMEDLSRVFDSRLSPGTVYPRLHDLEEDGQLRMQELVRTKEYRIDDEDACRSLVESAMRQHLALGLYFYSALNEL